MENSKRLEGKFVRNSKTTEETREEYYNNKFLNDLILYMKLRKILVK